MRRAPRGGLVSHDTNWINKNQLLFFLQSQLDDQPEAEGSYDQLDFLVNISYQINGLH